MVDRVFVDIIAGDGGGALSVQMIRHPSQPIVHIVPEARIALLVAPPHVANHPFRRHARAHRFHMLLVKERLERVVDYAELIILFDQRGHIVLE